MILTSKKRFLTLTAIFIAHLFLTSCNQEEVNNALTVIAVAAILTSDNNTDIHHQPNPPQYDECKNVHSHSDCNLGHLQHFQLTSNNDLQFFSQETSHLISNATISQQPKPLSPTEIMSQKYTISLASAELLSRALENAKQGDYSTIDEIGIAHQDLKALYENQKVSRYTTVNLSAAMGISFEDSKVLISKIKSDIQLAKTQLNK